MWIRQPHRWLSIAFTLAVIANIVAMTMQLDAAWIGFLGLVFGSFAGATVWRLRARQLSREDAMRTELR